MANLWLRLWHDMPNDPKWRTIARVSGQRIGDVVAVYVHLLVCASNAIERGRTQSFNCEDVATALDMGTEQVQQIVDAMQGRVLDGDMVAGWEKRQVAREDGSAERAKAWREAKKATSERTPNAGERNQTPDKDKDTDKEKKNTPKGADVLFDKFWTAYPKKDAKAPARRAFAKLNADEALVDRMLQALSWQTKRADWIKEGGQYIPLPATWLNAARWEDTRPDDRRSITVPGPTGPDPELEKIKAHKGTPIPPEIAARMEALKGKVH